MSDHAEGRITGLAGVLLWTTGERYAAMRRFYIDTLGLAPRTDRAEFVSFAWGGIPGGGTGAASPPEIEAAWERYDDVRSALRRALFIRGSSRRDELLRASEEARAHIVRALAGAGPQDVRLTISVHGDIEGAARDPLRVMINLGVDDIHAVAARLRASSVEFTRPPEQEPWGGWIATFADPDGNIVQLLQPTAAS